LTDFLIASIVPTPFSTLNVSHRERRGTVSTLRKQVTKFVRAGNNLIASHEEAQLSQAERTIVEDYLRDMPVLLVRRKPV
jgi:hypothetical protein